MPTISALYELANVYFACRDSDTLLKTFSARAGAQLHARAVFVWLLNDSRDALTCRARWSEPGDRLAPVAGPVTGGILAEMLESTGARGLTAGEVDGGVWPHLDNAGRMKTALYAPIPGPFGAEGVVEVLNRTAGDFTSEDAGFLEEASRLTAQALAQWKTLDVERQSQFTTLERLTSLYDLSRIFNSTLELQELLPIVANKIRDILAAEGCNVWLVDPDEGDLYLAQKDGEDPTVEEGARASLEESLQGKVASEGIPRLVENPDGEVSLAARAKGCEEDFQLLSWMCAPLRKEEDVVGVVELINKRDGTPFDEDDLFFLSSVCEQAAVALHNANLLESERKVHILDALLKISKEITSTLDLDHVLTTVVHQAAEVVPFDRCIIGFFDRNRFVIGALSGEQEVPKTPEMDALRGILEWAAGQPEPVAVDQYEDGWHCQPEEARAQVTHILTAQEMNGFYALPLRDDQGTLGALALLSGDADFLTDTQRETLSILANQTSVAIRNAQLYQQVPLASFLQPLAEKKQKFMAAMSYSRWVEWAGKLGVAALLLIAIPLPMRISTNATVVPAERRVVSGEVGGVVRGVFVHEGDSVAQRRLLAQLDDSDDRLKLAQAETNLTLANRALADAEFRNDLTAAGKARLDSALYGAEAKLEQQRVDAAQLRAPISGVIVTSKVEEKTGTFLRPGAPFCELVETDKMAVEMGIPESDMDLLGTGRGVVLKLNSYPTTTFHGSIERLGAQAKSDSGDQYFLVRAVFSNSENLARDGMVGKAKIAASGGWFGSGWYPVGYLIFRSPFRWMWAKVWGWLP
ncbi:MAG: GAF domain-containing protein [Candidatus Acidiferrales bacterium]